MRRLLVTAFVLNLLFLALVAPAYPAIPWLAADALVLAGLFALVPSGRWRLAPTVCIGLLYSVLVLCSAAGALLRESLGRSLNLYLDVGLLDSLHNLLTTNLNDGPALAVVTLAAVLLLALTATVAYALFRLKSTSRSQRRLAVALLFVGLIAMIPGVPGGLTAGAMIANQISLAIATRAASEEFEARINGAGDYAAPARAGQPLPGLKGQDVILGFIESYGISSLTDPRYEPLIRPRLQTLQRKITSAGLQVVTGRLRSPVQGGQSWLAHATLLSGLWVDSQLDYEVLLASDYPTMIDDFQATGHETLAIMPAITRDWPEGRQLGYDRIHHSRNMDYEGPNLNWVTMPDQYTWSFLQQAIREKISEPVFAEVALISSHAPWVPIIEVLDNWDSIGSGRVFNLWKDSGEAPDSLWRDHDRVRRHYARSIDYALDVVTEYAVRYVEKQTLLIIVGDHQAAPLVTGENASRDVLVHIISADQDLLRPFTGARGPDSGLATFQAGAFPTMTGNSPGMDEFRAFLQHAFSRGE